MGEAGGGLVVVGDGEAATVNSARGVAALDTVAVGATGEGVPSPRAHARPARSKAARLTRRGERGMLGMEDSLAAQAVLTPDWQRGRMALGARR